jgi:hypothetical protein
MKRKPIKIDWAELDEAFSSRQAGHYYLDSVTGHVALEGEGGQDDMDGDQEAYGVQSRVPNPAPLREEPTRLPVVPVDPERKLGWMKAFLVEDLGLDPEVVALLVAAVESDDPATELKDILSRHLEEREIWYSYRADRRHEMIDEWLEENGIEPIDPPPWR